MIRLYDNSRFTRRMNISVVVVIFAMLFGVWEAWNAYRLGAEAGGYGPLFAVLFIAGGLYGYKQLSDLSADAVVTLDADAATGASVVTLWKPFSSRRLEAPVGALTDWQFQQKAMRGQRLPIVTAHHPQHPRVLEFDASAAATVGEALQRMVPDAAAAFENARAR
jgi:hypothetical protein